MKWSHLRWQRMLSCRLQFFVGFLVTVWAGRAAAVSTGDQFPPKSIKGYESEELSAKAVAGKVTIVNFWATWCASCKVEIVEMEQKFAALLGNKDFRLAFVSVDKDPKAAAEWMKKNLKSPEKFISFLYKDPDYEAAESLSLDSFPMTLIIGADGTVKHVERGYVEGKGSTDMMAKLAEDLLKAPR